MKYQTEDPRWATFYPRFSHGFYVEKAGHFDERPEIHTSITQIAMLFMVPILCYYSMWFILLLPLVMFGWGQLYIHLPIKTGIQDCESAAWGLNYHDNKIWIYIGGSDYGKNWKTITMPWDLTWVRTSTLLKDGWHHETEKNRLSWEDSDKVGGHRWLKANKWKETHEYTDMYDNTKVNATIGVVEREWRPLGLKWTSLFAKKRKVIDIDFDKEVGGRKGSWKGGTIGCSYELKENETPLECLRRMEIERKL